MKLSEFTEALKTSSVQQAKALTEIRTRLDSLVDQIAQLETQIGDQEVSQDAIDTLNSIKTLSQQLDDIVPDAEDLPRDPNRSVPNPVFPGTPGVTPQTPGVATGMPAPAADVPVAPLTGDSAADTPATKENDGGDTGTPDSQGTKPAGKLDKTGIKAQKSIK